MKRSKYWLPAFSHNILKSRNNRSLLGNLVEAKTGLYWEELTLFLPGDCL